MTALETPAMQPASIAPRVEAKARELCEADGIPPDKEVNHIGQIFPRWSNWGFYIIEAKAALFDEDAARETGWQSIETAPVDQRSILGVHQNSRIQMVCWRVDTGWDKWTNGHRTWKPTHWRPLPAPPEIPAQPESSLTSAPDVKLGGAYGDRMLSTGASAPQRAAAPAACGSPVWDQDLVQEIGRQILLEHQDRLNEDHVRPTPDYDRVEVLARQRYELFYSDPADLSWSQIDEQFREAYRHGVRKDIAADPATPLLKECAEVMEEWKAADDYDGPLDKTVSRSIYHDAVTSRDALLERLRRIHHEV